MHYIVYETEECIKLAEKYNCITELSKLKAKIEIEQSIGTFERYLPSPYIRKYIGANFRLIAAEVGLDNNSFICFLKILPRGSKEYKDWLSNLSLFNGEIPSHKTIVEYYKNNASKDKIELPDLTTAEYEFLLTLHPNFTQNEEIIIESIDWVNTINQGEYEPYKLQFRNLLLELVENKDKYCNKNEIIGIQKDIAINYAYKPDINKYFLILPVLLRKSDCDISKITNKYINLEKIQDASELIKYGRKSYPSYVLADDDIWLSIQKNSEGNLALSPEENTILDKIRNNLNDSARYPIFINGRPGSGKTTILQYLYSDIIHFIFSNDATEFKQYPIYLTYNDNLLTVAKKTIKSILKCNADKVTNKSFNLDSVDFIDNYEKCFSTFQNMLYGFLDDSELPCFKRERYVDYTKFKELWYRDIPKNPDTYIRKKINPESAWHVIRTYIKGMSFTKNAYFDDEAYQYELARDQKTISDELFRNIYTKVWKGWYQQLLISQHYWDDQDLARYVLDEKKDLAKYSAIFCDEAQDFTKIELEIIINLTFFKKRSIPLEQLKNIPYAFAGDPFQTLNPTGFNWESVKANYHENIIKELDKSGASKLQLNYFELAFNYRSTKTIVGFSNIIQLLRGTLFGIKNLTAQKTWFTNDTKKPQFIYNNSMEIEKELQGQEEIVIIIPCQAGEEIEWVKSDPILREFALQEDKLIRNILSPMRAKGLEFNRVIIYNFGHQAAIDYQDYSLEKVLYSDEKAFENNPE